MKTDLDRAWDGVVSAACAAHREGPNPCAKDDLGIVPAGLMTKVRRMADDLGYPVTLVDCCEACPGALGETRALVDRVTGEIPPWSREIHVRSDMTRASTFRVVVHECSHAAMNNAGLIGLGMSGELIAEGTAALVTGALGVGSGKFSVAYLADYSGGDAALLEAARPVSVKLAEEFLERLR